MSYSTQDLIRKLERRGEALRKARDILRDVNYVFAERIDDILKETEPETKTPPLLHEGASDVTSLSLVKTAH